MFMQFLGAILDQWVVLMSGGIVTVGIGVWERWQKKTIHWRLYLWVMVLFLFFACYRAWLAEHKKVPMMRGTIERGIKLGGPDVPYTEIFILITLHNAGAPSGVENWNLTATTKELSVTVPTIIIPAGLTWHGTAATGFTNLTFIGGENAFYQKALLPGPPGGFLRGWLRFKIDGISIDRFPASTDLEVSFVDGSGTTVRCKRSDKGILSQDLGLFFSFPGVENPFPVPPQLLKTNSGTNAMEVPRSMHGLEAPQDRKSALQLLIQGFDPNRSWVFLPMPENADVGSIPFTLTNASTASAIDVYVVVKMGLSNAVGDGWRPQRRKGQTEYWFRAGNIHGGDALLLPELTVQVPPISIIKTNAGSDGINVEVLAKCADSAIAPRFKMFFKRGNRSAVVARLENIDKLRDELGNDAVFEFALPKDILNATNPTPDP